MRPSNIKVEKRGTRYWVVLVDNNDGRIPQVIHEAITKHDCLHYLAKQKKLNF